MINLSDIPEVPDDTFERAVAVSRTREALKQTLKLQDQVNMVAETIELNIRLVMLAGRVERLKTP